VESKTLYWTAAWINMLIILALGWIGARQAATAHYDRHRALMLAGAGLVVLFVASYGLKLAFLGREVLASWTTVQLWALRIHELCVFVMLVGGGIALRQALSLGLRQGPGRGADPTGIRLHRRAGFAALAGATAGVLTAAYVLLGMYERSSDGSGPEARRTPSEPAVVELRLGSRGAQAPEDAQDQRD